MFKRSLQRCGALRKNVSAIRERTTQKSRLAALKTPASTQKPNIEKKMLDTSDSALDEQDVIRKEQEALLEEADALLDLYTKRQSDSRMSSASDVSACATLEHDTSFEADIQFVDEWCASDELEASEFFKMFDALESKVENALKSLEECKEIASELDHSNQDMMAAAEELDAIYERDAKNRARFSELSAKQKSLAEQMSHDAKEAQAIQEKYTASAKRMRTNVDRLKAGLDDGSDHWHVRQVDDGVQKTASTMRKTAAKHYENPHQRAVRQQISSESLHQTVGFLIDLKIDPGSDLQSLKTKPCRHSVVMIQTELWLNQY